jgi:hypothetical protein
MNRIVIFLLTIFFFNSASGYGQTEFKRYTNQSYNFSFDIPSRWTIKYSKEQDGLICVPTTKVEKEIYEDCFEGIVFRMDFFRLDLDSALAAQGVYTKEGNYYYTSDRERDSVKTENIKGKNWIGIYHNNVCGISCKNNGFHAVGGQCEFIYFSNGKTTICINTNGRAFDNEILKRLINSFRFD